jgi:putative oxidoreductase
MLKAVSRLLVASVFIYGGIDSVRKPDGRAKKVAKVGIPYAREATMANGAAMAASGVALGLGILPKYASIALSLLLVPMTLVGHPFWGEEDPRVRMNEFNHFLKNVAIFGGLLWFILGNKENKEEKLTLVEAE